MAIDVKQLSDKLDNIQSDLAYIKQHIVNLDAVMTDDDAEALNEAKADLKAGKTKRL